MAISDQYPQAKYLQRIHEAYRIIGQQHIALTFTDLS